LDQLETSDLRGLRDLQEKLDQREIQGLLDQQVILDQVEIPALQDRQVILEPWDQQEKMVTRDPRDRLDRQVFPHYVRDAAFFISMIMV
jgi:hypothetical protein